MKAGKHLKMSFSACWQHGGQSLCCKTRPVQVSALLHGIGGSGLVRMLRKSTKRRPPGSRCVAYLVEHSFILVDLSPTTTMPAKGEKHAFEWPANPLPVEGLSEICALLKACGRIGFLNVLPTVKPNTPLKHMQATTATRSPAAPESIMKSPVECLNLFKINQTGVPLSAVRPYRHPEADTVSYVHLYKY